MFNSFNMFDDFDDIFNALTNRYQRPVKDQAPYSVYRAEGKGFIVICNTLGIDKKDLSVKIEKEKGRSYPILRIRGGTTLEKINFNNNVDLAIELKLANEIQDVSYEMKNGLTIVYIKVAYDDNKKNIEGKFIDGKDNTLDW